MEDQSSRGTYRNCCFLSDIDKVDFDSIFNQSSHTFSFGSPDILPMFAKGASPGKVLTWCYDEEAEDFTKGYATALDTWVLDQLRNLFQNASTDATLDLHLRQDKVIFFLHLLGLDTTGHAYRPYSKEYMRNIQVVDGEDPDNTRTPLIAWGKGIRGPLPDTTPSSHDEYSKPWKLDSFLRRDVSQADLAPLMASLIGIDWPVNSVGVHPDVDPTQAGYLATRRGDAALARYSFINVQVLLEHYRVKHEMKAAHALFYKPFAALEGESRIWMEKIHTIERLIEGGRWYDARRYSAELIRTCLEGLRYLETYDRLLIRAIVVVAYFGWAAYASILLVPDVERFSIATERGIDIGAIITLLSLWTVFWTRDSPWTFYVYVAFPCYFWREFCLRGVPAFRLLVTESAWTYRKLCMQATLVIVTLQSMVVCCIAHIRWSAQMSANKPVQISAAIQMGLLAVTMLVTSSSVMSLQAKNGLPPFNQIAAWVILVISSVYPFTLKCEYPSPMSKIISLFLAFGVCFVVLSISAEGLFYSAYTCNLLLWIEIEAILRQSPTTNGSVSKPAHVAPYHFQVDDIRIALFFLFYVQVAFFGTGNVASISSFYLEPVYRLVPIFNPFLMAALLIFKIVCPYVILSAAFAVLNARLGLPPFSLFLVALTLTDGMTVTFFLNVTDTGSWLEIGQSISFFCITSLLLAWSAGICTAGEYIMADTLLPMRPIKRE
ncbi:hypothetical protein ID866_2345 [Astraeus odoratus]|nr:hypothetical protein ID866_2345 [Astraeus odoratus]